MTLEEVALRANVSTATVSRVLSGAAGVRESTRRRVLEAVRELKYHPNLNARNLAAGRSRTIGMIVSNIHNPFFLDVFHSLETVASVNGYEVIVEQTSYNSQRLVNSVRTMLGRRPSGLALIVSEMDPDLIQDLTEINLPVVFYDVGKSTRNATNIKVRYDVGMQRAVEYLYSLQHRRMALIAHHSTLAPLQQRRRTFLEIVSRYGSSVEHVVVESADGPAGGRRAARELLDGGFQPTAILCVNDFMAIGVLRELHERGLSVPGDVSVTGFDNINLSEYTCPALTTVNIPRERIGQLVFEAIVPSPNRPAPLERKILINPEFVVRESTGPARR